MKLRKFGLILVLALLLGVLCVSALADDPVTITVYNWGQYISDGSDGCIDVIAAFEAETGIRVNYVTYDSNETMYTKLKTGGESYDVIIPSDYMIARMINEDMLLPLNFDNIPNFEYIDESFRNMSYDPENKYSVPYTWGTVGVIYNSKYVYPGDAGSWDLLWNPAYAGKILMFDNPRDAFAISELTLGYSLNTEDESEMRAATMKLIDQKKLVQAYVMDQVFDKMERAEAWIAPYYAGDYLLMVEENPDLEFFFPEEGFNLFVDACCIPKAAKNKEAAELFINLLCRPDICGENLEYLGYSVPVSQAKEYMDPELTSSSIAYPSEEILAKGESFSALSDTGNQLMNQLWLSVKTTDDVLGKYVIVTAVVIVLGIGTWLFLHVRRLRKKKRRGTY